MKRPLIILLLVTIVAGVLGTLIANDPGYVFVSYQDYSLQTGLWVMLGVIIILLVLLSQVARLVRGLLGSPKRYHNWRTGKQAHRASQSALKGMRLLFEGEYEQARRYLGADADKLDTQGMGTKDTDAEANMAQGINYLAAARAADAMGDDAARDSYLRLSEEATPALRKARQMTTAELALQRGDYALSLDALADLAPSKHLLHLKRDALLQRGDWQGMLALVPKISKIDQMAALAYEKQALYRGFAEHKQHDAELTKLYRSLSRAAREAPEIIFAYVEALSSKETVEPLLRQTIRREWCPQLLELYASLDLVPIKLRLKTTEKWLTEHPDDAALHYCLGCIYEQAGNKEAARKHYLSSLEGGGDSGSQGISRGAKISVHRKLASLLALEDDLVRSNQHLRIALEQAT